jgi:hypothetical protein
MTLSNDQTDQRLRAWRVEYANQAQPGKTALAVMAQPRAAWAYSQAIDPHEALADNTKPTADANGFTFIFIQSGSATVYEVQKQAEFWMAARPGEAGGILEVMFRSERLLWRRGRALCFGTPEFIGDMQAAAAHFSLCEGDLFRLEQQAENACTTLEKDIHLTDSLRFRDLKNRAHVDAMNRVATEIQLSYLRIERALEAPSPELSGPARRVFVELAMLALVEDRLLRLDDTIDAVDEHYRFVSERYSEYRYALRDYVVVLLILLVLFLQGLGVFEGTFPALVRSWFGGGA